MTNATRFTDAVTSGAFTLTLSRQHIGTLASAARGESLWGNTAAALFRRGLVDEVARPDMSAERTEYQITAQGAQVLQLCAAAGLVNAGTDVQADIIERQQVELARVREQIATVRTLARSVHARLEKAELEIDRAKRAAERQDARRAAAECGIRLKPEFERAGYDFDLAPNVSLRDPLSEVPTQALGERLDEFDQ